MAVLESCPKHNMVTYLEKTDGNTEFHEIISFLTRSSIHNALTVSPVVSTTFVEQFWMSAKSKIINNVRYITAKVAGKPVSISEASIRSDLLFDDADGIDSLPNQAIFDAIQLMGYLKGKPKLGLWYPRVSSFDLEAYSDSDYAGANLDRKSTTGGCQFLGRRLISWQCKKQTIMATSTTEAEYVAAANCCGQVLWIQNQIIQYFTKHIAIRHHFIRDAYEKKLIQVLKIHTDDNVADLLTKAFDVNRYCTDRPDEGTVDQNEGRSATQTALTTTTPTIFGDDETIAQVLIIMSQNKEKLKEKEKGVELKDVEETERPRPTSTRSLLTLKPLPKIDPKDKGKKMIEEEDESDTDSEDITEAEKKFKQLARDEEVARKVQEDWEAEEEVKKLAEEEATKAALSNEYDFIQARLNADKILAEKLQEEEREMYTIEQRAKFLHDTIAAQRRFLAQQRSEAIRNKPPSRNQLRNQMMTYLKHVGGKKHSDLKTKGFEEIKALYDKIKRSDDSFIAIGSAEDEKVIKEMNEQVADASKKRVKKDDSIKGEIKEEEGTRKRKLGIRKKMKSKKRKFTSKDDEELRLCLTIVSDEDKEVDYEILDKKYPIIEWRSEYLTTKPQYDETEEIEDVYLNVVIRSNRQRRYFSTLMAVLSILDRDDICAIYQLVMNRYQDETPEGFDKILWGDLIIMFNQSGNDEFWNAQQNWKIVSWKLHSSSGIHTIMTDEGIVIHMLVENKYPLKKEVLSQLLKLKLETEEDSTMALELIRFVKKQIAELEPEDSDGDEKDL
ncbi:hypothetical protein Tco_0174913 [Tanacetum coccineum]